MSVTDGSCVLCIDLIRSAVHQFSIRLGIDGQLGFQF